MATDQSILACYPFEGDFGEPGDTVLSNKMVVAAKPHECCHCKSAILKGERHRCQIGKYGDFMTHRWCATCCELMALCTDDDDYDGDDSSAIAEFEQRATQAAAKEGAQQR